jgi:hypothetical protein
MRSLIRILAPLALLLTLLVPVGVSSASPAISEHFETFVFEFNTCNREVVSGVGTIHFVTKEQKDGTFIQHYNLHGEGVGGPQGNEYVFNSNGKFRTSATEFSFDERIRVISKGSAPNQWVRFRLKDGQSTSETECRG